MFGWNTFLEKSIIELKSGILRLIRGKRTSQCLDINMAAEKIETLEEQIFMLSNAVHSTFDRITAIEQREAKREEAFQAQEDYHEEQMRPTMSSDYD